MATSFGTITAFNNQHVMPKPIFKPLPYQDNLAPRELECLEVVVLHCTELPDLAMAREYGEAIHYASGTGNSGHYYIDRDGHTEQWVALNRVAHHTKGHNLRSVGIELVNTGRYPDWHHSQHQTMTEAYPTTQIEALLQLLRALHQQLPNLKHIAGHEDLDTTEIPATDDPKQLIRRKVDPGPLFPWNDIMPHTSLINIGANAKRYE